MNGAGGIDQIPNYNGARFGASSRFRSAHPKIRTPGLVFMASPNYPHQNYHHWFPLVGHHWFPLVGRVISHHWFPLVGRLPAPRRGDVLGLESILLETNSLIETSQPRCGGIRLEIHLKGGHEKSMGLVYIRSTPHPVTVTTRIITFLVGNPYKPSFRCDLGARW